MKVYFYSQKEKNNEEQPEAHEQIFKFFKDNGVMILSNLLIAKPEQANLSFDKMDGLVIEGQESVKEAGYLIAQALAQGKPILYFLPKGSRLPEQLKSLQENTKLKKVFLLRHYSLKTLPNFLIDFIDIIETGELRREVPTVKFTLRFTPRSDRYLSWKSKKKKISKADYLRKLIDEQILSDQEYQTHLRKPKE